MPLVCNLCSLCAMIILLALFGGVNGTNVATPLERVWTPPSSRIFITGWSKSIYVYEPSFLPIPSRAKIEHAHAIVVDENDNGAIIITYKDESNSSNCLLRWRNVTEVAELIGPGSKGGENDDALCKGTPHGLITAVEDIPPIINSDVWSSRNESSSIGVLYHANNEQALRKTNMDGDIIWTVDGKLDQIATQNTIRRNNSTVNDDDPYSPTWFASQPGSPYIYLADGYGSSKIYVLNRFYGNYTGHSFGGYGTEHGKFQTCHSVAYDRRFDQMVVCDRENHRLEYFRIDADDPSVFDYVRTVSFDPLLRRPCNIRVRQEDGYAIVPFLEGSVGVLDRENNLVDVINITATLGHKGFLHPHDAHFVEGTSGDFVVVTWNPGRIGYFRRVAASLEDNNENHPTNVDFE